ncbi:response regulator [Caballeronia sp. AZ10_KS36]|uniref:response regulator n=1 Tax=Caballeronia sp. AZ10_KS36 TaxID=2921757 RepID=UPI00202805D9|nr:response regulator [Caballeronia sp. AZ10_KS36]
MKILVFDDDRDFTAGLAALIEQMGHEVTVAHECESARQLASAQLFDVILADVDLPDGDGRHTCDSLRQEGASQTAYMVAITGRHDLGDNDFPSFDGYMCKPVTYDLLERVLEEWRVTAGLDRHVRADEAQAAKAP